MTIACSMCNTEVSISKFCGNCGEPLIPANNGNRLDQRIKGKNNQSVQVGGSNSGTIIINQPEAEQEKTLIHRSFIKPLTIADRQITTWWFFIPGTLAVAANIVTVIIGWKTLASNPGYIPSTSSHWMMYILFAGALLLVSGFLLKRAKYITLPFVNKILETDKHGNLFITRITGTCGLCQSPVRIRTIGSKENRQTMVVCTNNPDQHLWHFDRTVLPDVGDDYRNNRT